MALDLHSISLKFFAGKFLRFLRFILLLLKKWIPLRKKYDILFRENN